MRVGVYIDGLNLYYGGRSIMGRGTPGWRWLDLRALSQRLLDRRTDWLSRGAVLRRIVYCTAFIDGSHNPGGRRDQDRYIAALRALSSFDHIEVGWLVGRVKQGPLAVVGADAKPLLVRSNWPVMIQDAAGNDVPNALFTTSQLRWEEKSTDVNVASHLLLDVIGEAVDAAIVISNDSDLSLPTRACRKRVPIGTINPSSRPRAGRLQGNREDGVGQHWWYRLQADDFQLCQLPDPVGTLARPDGW